LENNLTEWLSLHWFSVSLFRSYEWENVYFLYMLPGIPLLLIFKWLIHVSFRRKFDVALSSAWLRTRWFIQLARGIPNIFFMLFLTFVIIALARPQRTDEKSEQYREGIDIVLIMDVSESMMIEDFKPNRLEAAKEVATHFINGRKNDRIGIIVFSGQALTLCPLTTDYNWMRELMTGIHYGIIPEGGTAIGDAIGAGINHLRATSAHSRVIILLSDGENTQGLMDPTMAAELAYAYNIRIYPIGVGSDGMQPYGFDDKGKVRYVRSYLDEITMHTLAEKTKGKYFRAQNKTALAEIFQRINHMEKTPIKEDRFRNKTDYYQIYLTWSIVFFLFWLMLKNSFLNNFLED
jgi:Ca-activated chloride channel family protein